MLQKHDQWRAAKTIARHSLRAMVAMLGALCVSACDSTVKSTTPAMVTPSQPATKSTELTSLGEQTLHPPDASVACVEREARVEIESIDVAALYPKRVLEQRMSFLAACASSRATPNASARADVVALMEIYTNAKTAEDFAEGVDDSFELIEYRPVGSPAAVDDGAPLGLMTGYATPIVTVRLQRDEKFRYPFFANLHTRSPQLALASRSELLASDEALTSVLAWIDSPLAWALVETNGTASLNIETVGLAGTESTAMTRVATNGKPWTSLGKGLASRGLIDAKTSTLRDVVRAAELNPDAALAAALENQRVVYFTECLAEDFPPALGIPGAKLVAGYSCAADQSIYPPGSILIVVARAHDPAKPRRARLVFVHDAGGAIVGPHHVDAYSGEGTAALTRAGDMREAVDIYRLRLRD